MRNEHILELLERERLNDLGEGELNKIRAHTAGCDSCRRAYELAHVAVQVLKDRAALEIKPSPFFQTKVMAALRERQAQSGVWSLQRLWKTGGALVSSMAVSVVALAALTFLGPAPAADGSEQLVSVSDPYTGEEIVLAQDELSTSDISYDQVLQTIYELDEDGAR